MMRNVFFPTTIAHYYLFSTRILGVEINRTHIAACLVYKSGNKTVIERLIDEPIESGPLPQNERAAVALQKVISQCPRFDYLYAALSGSVVLFREVRFPFSSYEKIKMVIAFEIEPLLPFALNEAVIDFIITDSNEQGTTVLAVATQKKHVQEHLAIFELARIQPPDILTVDFLVLYDLYRQSMTNESAKNAILVDIDLHVTRVGYVQEGNLHQVRTIPQGTAYLAKSLSDLLHITPNQATEQMVRFGLQKEHKNEFDAAMLQVCSAFGNNIQFTIDLFAQNKDQNNQTPLVMFGAGARIPGFAESISHLLQKPCSHFDISLLKQGTIDASSFSPSVSSYLVPVGLTIATPMIRSCNLSLPASRKKEDITLVQQFATASILLVIVFGILIGTVSWRLAELRHEQSTLVAEALDALKNQFTAIDVTETDLAESIRIAEESIKSQEKTWLKFYQSSEQTPLWLLLELSRAIDKKLLGLDVRQLTIADNTVVLSGTVKDINALKQLERELEQTKRFVIVPPLPQGEEFSMKLQFIPAHAKEK